MVDIFVTLDADDRVTAETNPSEANRGEEVTWHCQGRAAGRGLRVVFQEDDGPFDGLRSTSVDQVNGTVRPDAATGLHFYNIFDEDTRLEWANPVSPQQNFGGIEIPRPPTSP